MTPSDHPLSPAESPRISFRRRWSLLGPYLCAACLALTAAGSLLAAERNQLALWGTIQYVDRLDMQEGEVLFQGEIVLSGIRSLIRSDSPLHVLQTDNRITSWKSWPFGSWPHGSSTRYPLLQGIEKVVGLGYGVAVVLRDGRVAVSFEGDWRFLHGMTEVVDLRYAVGHLIGLRADGSVVYERLRADILALDGLDRVTQLAGDETLAGFVHWDGSITLMGDICVGRTNVPPGLRGVRELSVGQCVVAVRFADGTVAGWGIPEAVPPPGIRNVVALAAGSRHLLARTADGRVLAWGDNTEGQAAVPPGLSHVVDIAAGRVHSVALRSDGSVVAWGGNGRGQTAIPAGLADVTEIEAWGDLTLAIGIPKPPVVSAIPAALHIPRYQNASLKVEARGFGLQYEWFQNGSSVGPPSPRPILDFLGTESRPGPGVITVKITNSAGGVTGGPVQVDLGDPMPGSVIAWSQQNSLVRHQAWIPNGLSNVVSLASAPEHMLALTAAGQVVGWGAGYWDQTNTPPGLGDVIAIAADQGRSVALRSDGTLIEWGRNPGSYRPPGVTTPMAVAVGIEQTLVLSADGRVTAWNEPHRTPLPSVDGLRGVVGIQARMGMSAVLFEDGRVESWGGVPSPCTSKPFPPGLADIRSLHVGSGTLIALGNNTQVYAWGANCRGEAYPEAARGFFSAAIARSFGAGLMEGGRVLRWGDWRSHHRPPAGVTWGIAADANTMYEIVGPPLAAPLRVQQTPSSTALIWRPFTRREVLEFTERLDPPQWRAVSGEPRRYNELRRLEIPPDAAAGYYRLVSP